MKHIHIGDVKLPLNEFAVSGTAILGIKKAGKTYCAKCVAEQLLEHGIPIIVFDAIGVWRYLKTPGDSDKAKGYKVVVAGGDDPDLPLTATNAEEIIRAAMKSNVSLVIDLYDSKLSKADWRKIVQKSFRTLLYENKKFGPRFVFLEEAAEYVPQKVYDGETFSEVEKFVRMGGNAQLGICLINQRSQEVNKSVLDLCDNLVLMRQRGNSAIDAVQKWMDKVSPDIADELTRSLPNMKKGEAWVWAEDSDTPQFTKTGLIRTFHPDRTLSNQAGSIRKPVGSDEFVSLMRESLSKVVEESKANDPRELKLEISRLKSELARRPESQIKTVDVPVLKDQEKKRLEALIESHERFESSANKIVSMSEDIQREAALNRSELQFLKAVLSPLMKQQPANTPLRRHLTNPNREPRIQKSIIASMDAEINRTQQRILDALAWYESIGVSQPTNLQVGAIALIDSSGGHFSNTVGPLSTEGLVVRGNGCMYLTDEGRKIASIPDNIATMDDYHDMMRTRVRRVGSGKTVEMLDVVINHNGHEVSVEEIGRVVGIDHTGGHFSNTIGPLGTLGLIDRRNGIVRPTEILFPKL